MKTYICAYISGDTKYLSWLKERLIYVYGAEAKADFVLTLDNFISYYERREKVPAWLDWLLRKYKL